ncbi:mannitol operon transcriptional activator MtlR [Bacillaceae bacterium]
MIIMYVSARERKILQLLLGEKNEITVKELAAAVEVSERTVHRDLKNVEEILRAFGLALEKRAGVGIRINGPAEKKKELEFFLCRTPQREFTPEERQTILLCSLLASEEPLKLVALADELNVTVATVSHDLTKVSDWLRSFDLTLIRKRGYGVQIEGSETAKRRAMSSLLMENMEETDLLAFLSSQIRRKSARQEKTATERLFGIVEKEILLLAEKAVEEIRDELPYSLADSAYIGLVVHLALALERLRQGEKIEMDPQTLEALKKTREYRIAARIIEKLRKALALEIPEAEIGYIAMHLKGAKLRNDQELDLEDTNFFLALQARDLIDYVSERTNVALRKDPSLFQGLIAHLQPAIYRITQKLGIHNPLLEEIKRGYGELFTIVKEGVNKTFPGLSVPEAEIGFLVLHFASSLERINEEKEMRALIICSSGIGSSKMLASRIKKELPEIKRLHYASVFDLSAVALDDYDVIISTIPLAEFPGEYILVNPFLSERDVKKIRARLQRRLVERRKNETLPLQDAAADYSASFQEIHEYAGIIRTILEGFRLTVGENPQRIDTALRTACRDLERLGVIEYPEAVVASLLEREKAGGLGIPRSFLALFHTRSPYVRKPSFTITAWKKPLEIRAMDGTRTLVTNLLLMLAPENSSKKTLEVLSYISALIIESEKSMALFGSQNRKAIASYLSDRFREFLRKKIDGRGGKEG